MVVVVLDVRSRRPDYRRLRSWSCAQDSDLATPFEWAVPGRIVLLASEPGTYDADDAARLRADPGPWLARFTAPLIDRRVANRDKAARAATNGQRGYDYRDYRQAYNAKVPEISKALAIEHVPFLAGVLMLLFLRSGRYYAEHFVVALHLMAFNMVVIQVLVHGMEGLHLLVAEADWHATMLNWIVRAVMVAYIVVMLRTVYVVAWHWSIAATCGLLLGYVLINFYLYRPVLFLVVHGLT